MVHYYLALALLLAPSLLATLASGILAAEGSAEIHLRLGFFTAILCVATSTLLILFMIVSGRVLKAAMRSRALSQDFLAELNQFFATKRSYPLAILAAFSATTAAVLGYGRFIGVPSPVHILAGLTAVVLNLYALGQGFHTLRANQGLLNRAAAELDRLDSAGVAPANDQGEPEWAYSLATRWLIFALSAWGPYLYWSLVVWRGDFGQVSPLFPWLTLALSALGLFLAWLSRADTHAG